MKPHQNFESLPLWEPLMAFVRDIYELTNYFPESEKAGMTRKLRDKATDIPMALAAALNGGPASGISEAIAATAQTETLLIICKNLNLVTEEATDDFQTVIQQLKAQLNSLNSRLQKQ
ncbi:MAG: four helix bundle protein [Bacteroidetes bacterium]|jgi:four helix bundle protein|nr:four helix bundle protein [Bacteroidota bacterium]MBU1580043.1 four helix bundle protein [Bacteroidota bacterium]MBU2557884.1 four helix bundle protein [Bacteroidota bacterium]MDA3944239.1 four helix bundle protein [Bacteroidota bacterium]